MCLSSRARTRGRPGSGPSSSRPPTRTSFEGGPFSFIHVRFLLSHVSEPEQVFGRLKGMLAPGGRIAVEDIDMSGAYCFSAEPAQDRFQALYSEAVRRGGGDANLGRRLPAVALAARLEARWRVFQPVHAFGPEKRLTAVTMDMIGASVLRYGLAEPAEVELGHAKARGVRR